MSNKVYFVTGGVSTNAGGLTRVLFNRSHGLVELGYDVDILTLDEKKNYEQITNDLRNVGRLAKNVDILNLYQYYRSKNTKKQNKIIRKSNSEFNNLYQKGFEVQLNEYNDKKQARYFRNGIYVMYKKWSDDGELSYINYFNENRVWLRREEYYNGYIYKNIFFDIETGNKIQELYYTPDGYCFLNKWYNPIENQATRLYLFNRGSREAIHFSNTEEFHTHWLNELAIKQKKPFIICDNLANANAVISINENTAYRIFQIHNNHFKEPYTYGSKVNKRNNDLFKQINKMDALVFLTNEQKNDVIKQYGTSDKIFVIPNSVSPMEEVLVDKDQNKITMFARYEHQKNITEAIYSFEIVTKSNKMAKLYIYGKGSEKEQLSKLIRKLKLEKNVFLRGYSFNVEEEMASSIATILTSRYEGFGLVILESMANSTPVISYDIKYGPKDIIEDGETGFLVPNGDRELLAKRILELINNPKKAIEMGKKAKKNVYFRFSETVVHDQWKELFGILRNKVE